MEGLHKLIAEINKDWAPRSVTVGHFDYSVLIVDSVDLMWPGQKSPTKRRIFKKLKEKVGSENFNQSMQSYLGYLGHANSFNITEQLKNQVWFWLSE